MKTYIVDQKDIADCRDGTARIQGKPVLLTSADMRVATKQIFFTLKDNPDLALVAGLGLSVKSSANQWRRISLQEFKKLVLDAFVLAREQTGGDGRCRLEIVEEPPPFYLQTVLQGRWLTPEVESFFQPIIKQAKIKIIKRP